MPDVSTATLEGGCETAPLCRWRPYNLLCCRHGYIPDDPKKYTLISRAGAEVVESVLEDFFVKDESNAKWTLNPIDVELQKIQIRRDAARKNGKKGGRPSVKKSRLNLDPVQNKPNQNRPQAQSGYDLDSAKNKPIVNSSPPPGPKKTLKSADAAESSGPDRDLYQQIKTIFEDAQLRCRFTSYPKEGSAIKQLLTKAKARDPTNPDVFLLGMIDQFRKMRGKDEFFRKQPFLRRP